MVLGRKPSPNAAFGQGCGGPPSFQAIGCQAASNEQAPDPPIRCPALATDADERCRGPRTPPRGERKYLPGGKYRTNAAWRKSILFDWRERS
jgi:hypothetical protein